MPGPDGVNSAGHVWSYGSLTDFQTDYEQAKDKVIRGEPLKVDELCKPTSSAPDTGLSRFLDANVDSELKTSALDNIKAHLALKKLSGEEDRFSTQEHRDLRVTIVTTIFGSIKALRTEADVLARMLEQKLLAERGKDAQLEEGEHDRVRLACWDALTRLLDSQVSAAILKSLTGASDELVATSKSALLNAALGLAEMVQKQMIAPDAIVTVVDDGRLFDMSNDLDVALMLKRSAEAAAEQFTQEKALTAEVERLCTTLENEERAALRQTVKELVDARKVFTRVLACEIHQHDPDGKLDDRTFQKQQVLDMKRRLQQFRYDLERCTDEVGNENGHWKFSFYRLMEHVRRGASNLQGDRHLDQRFATNADRVAKFQTLSLKEKELVTLLKGTGLGSFSDLLANSVQERAKKACRTTHEANGGARMAEVEGTRRRAYRDYGRQVLDKLQESGGSRTLTTEMSVSFLAALGKSSVAEAKLTAGLFKKTTVTLSATKNGGFSLSLGDTKGVRAAFTASALDETAKSTSSAQLDHSRNTELAFGNKDELIAFCRRHAPELLSALPGAPLLKDAKHFAQEALPRSLDSVNSFVNLGRSLGVLLGLRIHKTKNFSEAEFAKKLRENEVFTKLDTMLFERVNAQAACELTMSSTGGSLSHEGTIKKPGAQEDTQNAFSLKVGAGLHALHSATRRSLMTARNYFIHHTAEEMRTYVLEKEFNRFRAETEGIFQNQSSLINELLTYAEAAFRINLQPTPRSEAEGWLNKINRLRECYEAIEKQFLDLPPDQRKDEDRQRVFACQTRLFAVVTEIMAKDIEAKIEALQPNPPSDMSQQNDLAGVQETLTTARDFARNVLGQKLARPAVELEPDIYRDHLQFGREMKRDGGVEGKVNFSFDWDLGVSKPGESEETSSTDKSFGQKAVDLFTDAFKEAIPDQFKEYGARFVKTMTLSKGHVDASLETKVYTGAGETLQPWQQSDTLTFNLTLNYPLNPMDLVHSIVKTTEKALAKYSDDPGKAAKLREAAMAAVKEVARFAATEACTQLDAALSQEVTCLPETLTIMGALSLLPKNVSKMIRMPEYSYKQSHSSTLRISVVAGHLAEVSLSDATLNAESMKLRLGPPGAKFGLEIGTSEERSQSITQFTFRPNPTLTTLIGTFMGVAAMGDKEKAYDVLRNSMLVTNRRVKQLRNPTSREPLTYKSDNITTLLRHLRKLKRLAETTEVTIPEKLKEEAKKAYEKLFTKPDGLWIRIATEPVAENESDEDRVHLLGDLIIAINEGYGTLTRAQEWEWSELRS